MADFATALQGEVLLIFQELKRRTLNLDASVRMVPRRQFIGFDSDATGTFASVIPYRGGLRLLLNLRLEEISDPLGLCRDISARDHWGVGDVETEAITRMAHLDLLLPLVRQAFEHGFQDGTADTGAL